MKVTVERERPVPPPLKEVLIHLTPQEYNDLMCLTSGLDSTCPTCRFVLRLQKACKA